MKLKGYLLGFVLFCAGARVQAQESDKGILIDRIIAKVDNHYILKSEVEQQYSQYMTSGQANTPNRCQILEGLVVNKLMLAKAEIDSVIVDDKRIDAELNSRMARCIDRALDRPGR